jgi:hypothetical protein
MNLTRSFTITTSELFVNVNYSKTTLSWYVIVYSYEEYIDIRIFILVTFMSQNCLRTVEVEGTTEPVGLSVCRVQRLQWNTWLCCTFCLILYH